MASGDKPNFQASTRYSVVLGWYIEPYGVKVFRSNSPEMCRMYFNRFIYYGDQIGGDWEIIMFDHGDEHGEEPIKNRVSKPEGETGSVGKILTHLLYEDSEILHVTDHTAPEGLKVIQI